MKKQDRAAIWKELLKAEKRSRASKLNRFVRQPLLYPLLLSFDYIIYPLFKKGISHKAATFFGAQMKTILPSGTDIVLNGIKSHDSEIRLSKFLALQLQEGDTFIDIGAHYGYYTLLASMLVGEKGRVFGIEASAGSFKLLQENTLALGNVQINNAAAGDQQGEVIFYEYPGPYAEYNTMMQNAYENEKWLVGIKPVVSKVKTIVLDELMAKENVDQAIIKIDVEGGEPVVLSGLKDSFEKRKLIIVMEYLLSKEETSPHRDAVTRLHNAGFTSFAIRLDGELQVIGSVEEYLLEKGLTSDNIVFLKS